MRRSASSMWQRRSRPIASSCVCLLCACACQYTCMICTFAGLDRARRRARRPHAELPPAARGRRQSDHRPQRARAQRVRGDGARMLGDPERAGDGRGARGADRRREDDPCRPQALRSRALRLSERRAQSWSLGPARSAVLLYPVLLRRVVMSNEFCGCHIRQVVCGTRYAAAAAMHIGRVRSADAARRRGRS